MAIPPPLPPDEDARLAALRRLRLLDSEADPAYEALAALAARLLGTPMSAINFVDADRQWTKAGVGLTHGGEDPRAIGFCPHVVAGEAELWVVADAANDPRFADNPLVTGGRVGFYAGAPVTTADGHRIGTLCVVDPQPRANDPARRLQAHDRRRELGRGRRRQRRQPRHRRLAFERRERVRRCLP